MFICIHLNFVTGEKCQQIFCCCWPRVAWSSLEGKCLKNCVVSKKVEPGSVLKSILVAARLAWGLQNTLTQFVWITTWLVRSNEIRHSQSLSPLHCLDFRCLLTWRLWNFSFYSDVLHRKLSEPKGGNKIRQNDQLRKCWLSPGRSGGLMHWHWWRSVTLAPGDLCWCWLVSQ